MSKLDIGVGDDFPLGDGEDGHRDHHRHGGRHHRRHHAFHHHPHHHHHHRGHRPFGLFAKLLVIAGLAALVIEHKLTTGMAYGMIGVGAVLLVASFAAHALWHRRLHRHSHHHVQGEGQAS